MLDVRTPEEFAEGHLDGAVLVDFYDADFADQLAELDPDVPYLVYCRSGNRSGQTLDVMEQLGFTSAVDVDGGIVAWQDAGLPVVVELTPRPTGRSRSPRRRHAGELGADQDDLAVVEDPQQHQEHAPGRADERRRRVPAGGTRR